MVNSQINHLTPDTAHAISSNFWRHQVMTAQDFGAEGAAWHRVLCFFLSGGLNYQVEHHLFPTVNHCHHARLHPIVKQLCCKHKVPFGNMRGYAHALALHLEHTRAMAHRDRLD
jgi:fatty acid desaturase